MNSAEDLKDLTYDPPDFPASELNFCVRCGSCKELCPTYMEDVTEGMSARGRVMLLKKFFEGEMEPSETLDKRVFSCMLCGACNRSCPLGINITDAIYEGRKNLRQFSNKRRLLSLCMSFALKKASTGFRILKFIEGIGEILPVHRLQPFKVLKEMGVDSLDSTLRDGMSLFKVSRPKGRIAVFAGCTVNFLYPHIGRSLIHSLNTMNYDVILPKGEACCGAPLLGLGLKEDAAELAYRNMATFKKMNVEAVIGLCPTCVHFIRNEYKRLIGDAIENAVGVSQFFSNKLPAESNNRAAVQHGLKVIYHDPCHSVYSLNVSAEPRQVLKSMGLDLIDAERGCCGFGGTFRLLYQDMSKGILERRVEQYMKADMIVTSCPNCILQFRSRIKDRQVKHIVELIEQAVQGDKK